MVLLGWFVTSILLARFCLASVGIRVRSLHYSNCSKQRRRQQLCWHRLQRWGARSNIRESLWGAASVVPTNSIYSHEIGSQRCQQPIRTGGISWVQSINRFVLTDQRRRPYCTDDSDTDDELYAEICNEGRPSSQRYHHRHSYSSNPSSSDQKNPSGHPYIQKHQASQNTKFFETRHEEI